MPATNRHITARLGLLPLLAALAIVLGLGLPLLAPPRAQAGDDGTKHTLEAKVLQIGDTATWNLPEGLWRVELKIVSKFQMGNTNATYGWVKMYYKTEHGMTGIAPSHFTLLEMGETFELLEHDVFKIEAHCSGPGPPVVVSGVRTLEQ